VIASVPASRDAQSFEPGVHVGGSGGTITGLKATMLMSASLEAQSLEPGVQVGGKGGTITGLVSETVALTWAGAETGLANARPALAAKTAAMAETRNL